MTTEEIARTLAEITVPDPHGVADEYQVPDPRFAALRGEHEWIAGHLGVEVCKWSDKTLDHYKSSYCLQTDVESWLEVARECRYDVKFGWNSTMDCAFCLLEPTGFGRIYQGHNPTYRDALAAAIWDWYTEGQ
jgi:hypothetical protein